MIKDYVGIPFVDGGRGWKGCDCWGLVRLVFKEEFGIELVDYKISYELGVLIDDAAKKEAVNWVPTDKFDIPCLVEVRGLGGLTTHVGVSLTKGKMLHTNKALGSSTVISLGSLLVRNRVKGYWKHHEMVF